MNILIRLPNWLGDVVMSTAFIAAVKQSYPGAAIDVVIKKELSGLAALIPGLRTIYPFSKSEYSGLTGVYRFGKKLRSANYDLYFNLPSSLSSAVMARASNAKKRIGFGKEGGVFLLTNSYGGPLHLHRVDEYVNLLEQFTRKRIEGRTVRLETSKTDNFNAKRVIVNFNSEADSRRMPLHKGIDIVNLLIYTFPDVIFTFIGSPKETAFVNQFITGAEKNDMLENYAGKTDLAGLSNLMADSAAVLTTDSGPAHLANGLGRPVIALFGAGNENNTAPYNTKNLMVLRAGRLSCEPCVRNTCHLYGIPKCMELIDQLRIINSLSVYLPHA